MKTPKYRKKSILKILDLQRFVKSRQNKKGQGNIIDLKIKYNSLVKTEVTKKYYLYKNLGQLQKFEEIFAVNNYFIVRENDQWQILKIFQIT